MEYKLIRKHRLKREMIAKWFGYKSVTSFNSSSANRAMMEGIEQLLQHIEAETLEYSGLEFKRHYKKGIRLVKPKQ